VESQQKAYKKYIIIFSLALAGFTVLFISIMLKGIVSNIIEQIDNTLYAQFLSVRERLQEDTEAIKSGVILVGIDDRTLNKLGAYNPLKFRSHHIDALANILKGEPAAVAYDIFFGDPHDNPEVDLQLADTMKKGPVFSVFFGTSNDRSDGMCESFGREVPQNTGVKFVTENGFESMSPHVLNALTGIGLANAYPDTDGLLRKMPMFFRVEDRLYPTIALEIFRKVKGISLDEIRIENGRISAGETTIPIDENCRAYVNIDQKYKIREISFYDVWKGRVPARYFKDKVVFIAATAIGLGDNKLVPLYGYISGVLIHANLFLNLTNNRFINEVTGKTYYFLIFLASLFYCFIYYFSSDVSTFKKLMGFVSNIPLATKFGEVLLKMTFIDRALVSFRSARERHYGIRYFFLLFTEARKRIEPLLLHLILLYLALFLLFYFFLILIKPTAIIIQLFIAYIIVSNYKGIDFGIISPAGEVSG